MAESGAIERVYEAEVVEDSSATPSWEELVSEFVEGSRYELHGQLRQARAAANVCRHYGRSSMKQFAGEVGKSPSWCYDLARVWFVYGHLFEDGSELSNRLETLGITHLIKSLSAPDPVAHAIEAHDEGYSTRQTEETAQQKAIEQTDEDFGKPERVEVKHCPSCGAPSDYWQRIPEGTSQ